MFPAFLSIITRIKLLGGPVYVYNSMFGGPAYVDNLMFGSPIYVYNSMFGGPVYVDNSMFGGLVYVHNSMFGGPVYVDNSMYMYTNRKLAITLPAKMSLVNISQSDGHVFIYYFPLP